MVMNNIAQCDGEARLGAQVAGKHGLAPLCKGIFKYLPIGLSLSSGESVSRGGNSPKAAPLD